VRRTRPATVLLATLVVALLATMLPGAAAPAEADRRLETGLEVLLDRRLDQLRGKRVGLITNPTGVDRNLRSSVDRLIAHEAEGGYEVTALYGPEHGVRGGVPAGAYVESTVDPRTGLPIYSLYGPTRKPTPAMLADIDVLLYDIQDIGARFYTYISTLSYVMEAAAEEGKEVIVLDRPNPLGDRVEGPVLDPSLSSFVGLHPIPLRHGMTVGEIALLFNAEYLETPADLRVIEMRGYDPSRIVTEYPLEWVPPSPNIPTRDTAFVYPGTGLVESLNVSEGRGTTTPFEWVGASWFDEVESQALVDDLNGRELPGVTFRSMFATPTASKEAGRFSGGVALHVTDERRYESVRTGLHVLDALRSAPETDWREGANCRTPEHLCWIDTLTGTKEVRAALEAGTDPDDIVASFDADLVAFRRLARPYRLYR